MTTSNSVGLVLHTPPEFGGPTAVSLLTVQDKRLLQVINKRPIRLGCSCSNVLIYFAVIEMEPPSLGMLNTSL